MFAEWTKNTLFILIENFHLLYHSFLISSEHDHLNQKKSSIINNDLLSINAFVDRFINVLTTPLNVAPHLLTNETVVLKQLFLLIKYFTSLYNVDRSLYNSVRLDKILSTICLDIINSTQSFIITDCLT